MFSPKPKTYAQTVESDLETARFDLLAQRKLLETAETWVPTLEKRVARLISELETLTSPT